MEFSHEYWMPCLGLTTTNIGAAVEGGLRQYFDVY